MTPEDLMHRLVLLLLLAALTAGCNTVNGIGKDIEEGGKAIQRTTKN
jgi:entericidin B